MQHVQKNHTLLGNILPEIFVIQIRDCGVSFTPFLIITLVPLF
jgi:hypothetical protein